MSQIRVVSVLDVMPGLLDGTNSNEKVGVLSVAQQSGEVEMWGLPLRDVSRLYDGLQHVLGEHQANREVPSFTAPRWPRPQSIMTKMKSSNLIMKVRYFDAKHPHSVAHVLGGYRCGKRVLALVRWGLDKKQCVEDSLVMLMSNNRVHLSGADHSEFNLRRERWNDFARFKVGEEFNVVGGTCTKLSIKELVNIMGNKPRLSVIV